VIRVRGIQTGEYTSDDVIRQSHRLLDLPLLASDKKLAQMRVGLDGTPEKAITAAIRIMDDVADRYRVYRRVLRNRRQTLVRDGKLQRVERLREITNYRAGLLETNAISAVDDLLSQAQTDGRDLPILGIFARLLWQSLASSECALDLLRPLLEISSGQINPKGRDFLALGHLAGYDDWPLYKELLQRAVVGLIRRDLLVDAVAALTTWNDSPEANTRLAHLVQVLRSRADGTTPLKILVFAGYPGLALGDDVCGRAELAGESVAVPSAGATAAALVLAEVLRLLHDGPVYTDMKIVLSDPDRRFAETTRNYGAQDLVGIRSCDAVIELRRA
jgi:ATP-dependent helicase HepA